MRDKSRDFKGDNVKPLFTEKEKFIFNKIDVWRNWLVHLAQSPEIPSDEPAAPAEPPRQDELPFERLCSHCPRS